MSHNPRPPTHCHPRHNWKLYLSFEWDFNIHHKSWLKYSREESAKGRKLKEISESHGLRQLVKGPTRGEYLLDLVLSSHVDVKVSLKAKIAEARLKHAWGCKILTYSFGNLKSTQGDDP